ncbi:hypothetical protein PENSPDRAFT_580985 [Peniophora sp. CONT]|nr:hypothetical protein PENSPDRAFT_580985 [Peniophora sp. CONT]
MSRSLVSAATFLAYDILLTLRDEIALIWPKPHTSWIKWLFIFVRYFALGMQLSLIFVGTDIAAEFHYTRGSCVSWYIYQEVATDLLVAAVEIILMLRVNALYNSNRWVTWILAGLFVVENLAILITLIKVVPSVQFDSVCVVTHSPFSLLGFGIAVIAFETVLLVLMLVKFVEALSSGWGDAPILTVVVRDGIWAFALVFFVLCINAGFYLGLNGALAAVAYQWIISVESFAGYRLILNMHHIDQHGLTDVLGPGSTGAQLTTNIEVGRTIGDAVTRQHLDASRGGWFADDSRARSTRHGRVTFADEEAIVTSGEEYEMTPTATSSGTGSQTYPRRPTVADGFHV